MASPRIDRLDKNYLINGNFDFWQRGVSLGVTGGSAFLSDRYKFWADPTNNWTCSRDTDVPTLAQSGTKSSYSMKFLNNSSVAQGATSYVYHEQTLEGIFLRDLIGETCTISFWMKSSVIGDYTVGLYDTASDWKYLAKATVNVADTWEKKVITLDISDTVNFPLDNSGGMRITVWMTVGTDYQSPTINQWANLPGKFGVDTQVNWSETAGSTCFFSQMKLSKGVEQEFSMAGRDYAEELRLCQRYYQLNFASGGGEVNSVDTINREMSCSVNFLETMRTIPAVDVSTVIADQNVQSSNAYNIKEVGFSFKVIRSTTGVYHSNRWAKCDAEL